MLRPAGKFSQPIGNDRPPMPSLSAEVRVVSQGKVLARSAPELLEDYVRTGSQVPFEEVVRRYAGMVFNVCYQILKDSHDAEDATQAVFLALAVQAKTANGVKYIAPWLQKVAQRLSLDVRRSKTRRKAREERHSQMRLQMGIENDPTLQPGMDELKIILRDELDKLPSKYRLPLVLHYFGGLKPEEISRELGCKPSTLGVRLHRGRKMLADLLSERGVVVNGSMLSIALAACVQCRISETLVHTTAHAAGAYAMQGTFAGAVTPQVIGFKHIASQGIFLAKVKAAVAVGILAAAAAAGAAELVNRVMPQSWRFDFRTELREWLKPTFNTPAPGLRVDAGDSMRHPAVFSNGAVTYELNPSAFSPMASERSPFTNAVSQPTSVAVGSYIASTTEISDTPFGAPVSIAQKQDSSLPNPVVRSVAKSADISISSSGTGDNAIAASASGAAGGGGSTDGKVARLALAPPPSALVVHNPNGTSKAPLQPFMPKISDHLSIAAGQGEVQNYVFDKSTKLSTDNFSIGGQGASSLTAECGTFSVSNRFVIGDAFGGTGAAIFDRSSAVYAPTVAIGENGKGTMSVRGHATILADSITAGQNSPGTINLSGGSIESKSLAVGQWNTGVVNQEGGVARMSNFLGNVGLAQLGVGAGSEGTYYLRGGLLEAGRQVVGVRGYGHLYQTGGLNSVQTLEMGSKRGSLGSMQLPSGTLQFTRSQPDSPVANEWIVGREGRGEVILSSANSQATINEVGYGEGTNFIIRGSEEGSGRLLGWGRVMLTGTLDQSGVVIADGYGHSRTLDLSAFAEVINSFDNTPDGSNGWYARNGGKLRLPINRSAAPGSLLVDSYTYGEATDDADLDMVNAVRMIFDPKLDESMPVMISLVSSDHGVPAAPKGLSFTSIYETNLATLPVESVELSIRYDAVAVGDNTPRLLAWNEGGWRNLADSEFQIDMTNRLIVASTSPATFYAVAVPEPVGTTLILLATALFARRRRLVTA